MRNHASIGGLLTAAGILLALAGAAWATQVDAGKNGVGSIITKPKNTFVIRAGARPPGERASLDNPQLFEGDALVTREDGRVDILLDDGSVIRLRENTNLVLKEKKPGKQKSRLQVLLGRIWAKVTQQENLLEIETPSAVAAIKGTALELIVLPSGEATLIVWDGLVKLFNEMGEVLVKASQQSQVNKGQAPGAPVTVNLNQLDQWWKSSLALPPSQTLKTTVKDQHGQEYQLNLKYDRK